MFFFHSKTLKPRVYFMPDVCLKYFCLRSLKDRVWDAGSQQRPVGPDGGNWYKSSQQQLQLPEEACLLGTPFVDPSPGPHCVCVTPWGARASYSLQVFFSTEGLSRLRQASGSVRDQTRS